MNSGGPEITLALCSVGELFGGVERQVLGLCQYWLARGREPRLYLFFDRELADRARALGVDPVVIRGRHRYDPRAASLLAQAVVRDGVNLVHAHGYRAAITCALARRQGRFALVKTEHGRIEPAGGHPLNWLKIRFNSLLDRVATRRAAAAVCYVTHDISRHFDSAHVGLVRFTIHNGIEPLERGGAVRPQELAATRTNLGIVGRVTAVKGITYALRALASGEIPDTVRLHVIGDGPLTGSLRHEAASLGLGEKVRFLGFRRNVYDYIAHLDLLLMPSLHEGLPYTLLEAMSLGTPVLASRVGGLAEVIQDGRTGVLHPVGDVAALRAAVVRAAQDPDLMRALGQAARADQRERYTLTRMGDDYHRVYAAALADGSGHEN